MIQVQAGSIIVEFTADNPGLFGAITVYDWTGITPVLVGVFPATNIVGNSYAAKFTGAQNKLYFVWKAFYNDPPDYTDVNTDEPQGSEAYDVVPNQSVSGGGSSVVGPVGFVTQIDSSIPGPIVGVLVPNNGPVVGVVE